MKSWPGPSKERPAALGLIERALAADAEHPDPPHRAPPRGPGPARQAHFGDFRLRVPEAIDKPLVLQLAELDFIRAHEDVVLTGNSGARSPPLPGPGRR